MVRKIFILMLAVIFIACQKSKENGELNSEILPLTPKAEINKESYAMIVDTPPGIIGGLEAIQKKIKYPDSAIKNRVTNCFAVAGLLFYFLFSHFKSYWHHYSCLCWLALMIG